MTVIIIGAGMAGLAAARDLSLNKINVVILEAQHRVGGRVYTNDVDLGASWLHDSENNELYPIARKLNALLTFDTSFCYYKNGKAVSDRILDTAYRKGALADSAPNTKSLYQFARDVSKDIQLKETRHAVMQVMQAAEHWTGMSWHKSTTERHEKTSPDAFNLSGNNILVDWLFSEINWNYVQLELNTPVKSIGQEISSKYKVVTESGTCYVGSDIICTIPVGAMKIPGLFDMPLPLELRNTIEMTPMAALGKVALEFDSMWWDQSPDRVEVLSNSDPEMYPADPKTIAPGDQPVFFTYAYKAAGRPMLIALIAPPLTQHLEANPSKAFEFLLPALSQIRSNPNKSVPTPKKVLVTDWTQNRFFKGSYTGVGIGQNDADIIAAFEKGFGRLRFAGEHTIVHGSGCMHGAYCSGQREAKNVMQQVESTESTKRQSFM